MCCLRGHCTIPLSLTLVDFPSSLSCVRWFLCERGGDAATTALGTFWLMRKVKRKNSNKNTLLPARGQNSDKAEGEERRGTKGICCFAAVFSLLLCAFVTVPMLALLTLSFPFLPSLDPPSRPPRRSIPIPSYYTSSPRETRKRISKKRWNNNRDRERGRQKMAAFFFCVCCMTF